MAFSMDLNDDGHDEGVLADINVTPLVDVMLVLLIIFMITAPMLHQGVDVALPKAEAEALPMAVEDPLVLSINRDGILYIKDDPVHPTKIVERLEPLLKTRSDDAVFLKADTELPYGDVMAVLDLLNRGGIVRVGLVTEPTR